MKRRITKKWINRYITPTIEGLPQITTHDQYIDLGVDSENNHIVIVANKQHVIGNGRVTSEGVKRVPCRNLLLNIKRTAQLVEDIKREHQYVYLRTNIEVRGRDTYMRLITEW